MANISPDDEILEFAIAREMDANRFYITLAERVENPEMRKVFEDLAEEELEHKAKLELEVIKSGKVVQEAKETADFESYDCMTAIEPELDMDYRGMLVLAMEKEEAAFRTYVNLIPQIKDQQSREVLMSLAEEEVKHKLRFEVEYDMIMKQG